MKELKQCKQICKSTGQRCRYYARIEGYCTIHYRKKVMKKNEFRKDN